MLLKRNPPYNHPSRMQSHRQWSAISGMLDPIGSLSHHAFGQLRHLPCTETNRIPTCEPNRRHTKYRGSDNWMTLDGANIAADPIKISVVADTLHLCYPRSLRIESRRGAPNSSARPASSLGKHLRSSSTWTWIIQAPLAMPTGPHAISTSGTLLPYLSQSIRK